MKRVICWLIGLVLMYSSFAVADGGAVIDESLYEMRVYTETANDFSSVYIPYPWLGGINYGAVDNVINVKAKEIAEMMPYNRMGENEDLKRTVNYECEVTHINDTVISMVFYGISYYEYGSRTSESYRACYGLTVDLLTSEIYKLTSVYNVDTDFIDTVYYESHAPKKPKTVFDDEIFPHMIGLYAYYSKDGNALTYSPSDVQYYLVDDGIVLLLSSYNARDLAEPQFEAYLKNIEITEFYQLDKNLWY